MSTDTDAKREATFARWEQIRERGPLRFILLRGVLGWGVTTAVLWCALMALFTEKDWVQLMTVALVGFPAGGVVWGTVMWFVGERKFARTLR